MLSDLLKETIEEIEAWQEAEPHVYAPHHKEIEALKQAMRTLVKKLDRLPLFDDDEEEEG